MLKKSIKLLCIVKLGIAFENSCQTWKTFNLMSPAQSIYSNNDILNIHNS